ncbi:hypothetical protein I4F81_001536 [Pyropia yezoensis]|uniref:Uncharacterized protein n=1 Tax=Pyropia yezoensis TaxID=2788 RepID=A0ACC3BM88_PYRYE|nr:hypothetical protein I4F81_001536 [Neopyropia yezoensis]
MLMPTSKIIRPYRSCRPSKPPTMVRGRPGTSASSIRTEMLRRKMCAMATRPSQSSHEEPNMSFTSNQARGTIVEAENEPSLPGAVLFRDSSNMTRSPCRQVS